MHDGDAFPKERALAHVAMSASEKRRVPRSIRSPLKSVYTQMERIRSGPPLCVSTALGLRQFFGTASSCIEDRGPLVEQAHERPPSGDRRAAGRREGARSARLSVMLRYRFDDRGIYSCEA
jgi:hypothetical protein